MLTAECKVETSVRLNFCLQYPDHFRLYNYTSIVGLKYTGGTSADITAAKDSPYRPTAWLYFAGSSADRHSIAEEVSELR